MTYRDDDDAARHRADALQRELDHTQKALDASDRESEELKDDLDDAEKRAAASEKRVDKLERKLGLEKPAPKSQRKMVIAVVGATVASGILMAVLSGGGKKAEPKPKAPAFAKHKPLPFPARRNTAPLPAKSRFHKAAKVHSCLARVDHFIRMLRRTYAALPKGKVEQLNAYSWSYFPRDEAHTCVAELKRIADQKQSPKTDAASVVYRNALQKALPLLLRASRYYKRESFEGDKHAWARTNHQPIKDVIAAYIEASDALRATFDPMYESLVRTRIARLTKTESAFGHVETVHHRCLAVMRAMVPRTVDIPALAKAIKRLAAAQRVADEYASSRPKSGLNSLLNKSAKVSKYARHFARAKTAAERQSTHHSLAFYYKFFDLSYMSRAAP